MSNSKLFSDCDFVSLNQFGKADIHNEIVRQPVQFQYKFLSEKVNIFLFTKKNENKKMTGTSK